MVDRNEQVGEVLLGKGVITRRQLDQALLEQLESSKPLDEVLLQLGFVTQSDLDDYMHGLMREQLLGQLQLMFDMEMVISDFYYMCAEHYAEAAEFWKTLGNDEVRHALSIGKIIEAIYESPKAFGLGFPVAISEIERVIELVRAAYRRVKKDELPLDEALILTHKIENAMMEGRFFDLLSTGTPRAQELLETVKHETAMHMRKIIEEYSKT